MWDKSDQSHHHEAGSTTHLAPMPLWLKPPHPLQAARRHGMCDGPVPGPLQGLSCSGRCRTAWDKELLCGQKHGHTDSGATSPASPSHLSCCGRFGSSICQGCVWTLDHTLLRLKTISLLLFHRVFITMEIQLHLIHSTTAN